MLAAMRALPDVLEYRGQLPAPLIPGRLIEAGVVNGPWRPLVFGHPTHADGAVDRHAYTFCVLEQFWRHLKRREIYAEASTKWRNPQAQLLIRVIETTLGQTWRPPTPPARSSPPPPPRAGAAPPQRPTSRR